MGIRISNSFSPDEVTGWAAIIRSLQRGDRPDVNTKIFQQLARKSVKMQNKLQEKRDELAAAEADESG